MLAHTVGMGIKGCITWSTTLVRNYRDYSKRPGCRPSCPGCGRVNRKDILTCPGFRTSSVGSPSLAQHRRHDMAQPRSSNFRELQGGIARPGSSLPPAPGCLGAPISRRRCAPADIPRPLRTSALRAKRRAVAAPAADRGRRGGRQLFRAGTAVTAAAGGGLGKKQGRALRGIPSPTQACCLQGLRGVLAPRHWRRPGRPISAPGRLRERAKTRSGPRPADAATSQDPTRAAACRPVAWVSGAQPGWCRGCGRG